MFSLLLLTAPEVNMAPPEQGFLGIDVYYAPSGLGKCGVPALLRIINVNSQKKTLSGRGEVNPSTLNSTRLDRPIEVALLE